MASKNYRPAGLSSDEDDSDSDYEFSVPKNKNCYQNNSFSQPSLTPEEELFIAVKNNELTKVRELVSKGVDLNLLDGGWSPLMYSCFYGFAEITKFLLEKGSNMDFHKDFFTPLMAVCSSSAFNSAAEREECVKILIDRGIDINALDRTRTSALMLAAREGFVNIVKLLIDKGCEINKQDKDGWSALFHAVNNNHQNIVDIFISSGANIKLKDVRGRTIYDLAMNKGYDNCALKLKTDQVEELESLFNIPPVLTIKQMLSELPSRNDGKNPGFSSDIFNLLVGMDLQTYAEKIYGNNVQLPEFLVMNDDDLKQNGVYFSTHRKNILNALKRFHMSRWQKASIGLKPKDEIMELIDGVKLVGNVTRQLCVLQTTLHYVQLNKTDNHVTEELKRIVDSALQYSDNVEDELVVIKKFADHIERVKKVHSVDLILKEDDRKKSIKRLLKMSVNCAVILLGGLCFFRAGKYVKTTSCIG